MPNEMPLVRIAELEIDPRFLDQYRALLAEEIEASIASEPGVHMLLALANKGNPTELRIVEVYADDSAYQAHLQSPHFLKYKSETSGMIRSLRLVETDPILLGGWNN
jgi:quinol monooxygenase YgiN